MANKSFIFQLRPTTEQLESIKSHGGAARWIWNQMLAGNIEKYKAEQKFNFHFAMTKLVTELRNSGTVEWLSDINSQSLQAKCKDLDTALHQNINKVSGFPKFKQKSSNNDSFRVPQFFKISDKGIKLPKIDGWIKWKQHRKIQGKAKSITIKQDGEHWVAVVLCELPDVVQRTAFVESEIVGLDVGLTDFIVTDTGEKVKNPKHLKHSEKLLKSKQRKLSKKCKGSSNRNKARAQVAKLHRHVKNQRNDFQWKLASSITKNFAVVATEDLNIKGMVKNHKLAKAISGAGWYGFKTKLTHKLQESGGILVNVNPRNTSKTCSECGCLHEGKMELSIRSWTCLDCGTTHDRDVNAARNIKAIAMNEINRVGTTQIYACGDTSGGDSVQTESSHVSLKHENPDMLISGSSVL